MENAHYAEPAPDLVDGKRVFVAGQEIPSRGQDGEDPGPSGYYFLVDADPLFEAPSDEGTRYDEVAFDNYVRSPHNVTVTADGWVHAGHYHAGVRFLHIEPPAGESLGRGRGDPQQWGLEERDYWAGHEELEEGAKANGLTTAEPNFWTAVEADGITFGSCINTGLYATVHDDVDIGD
jgi:hypothetical protein